MRNIVIVYCGLTLAFSGGCVFLLFALGSRADLLTQLPQAIVTLSAAANALFLWLAWRGGPKPAMVAGGILYAAVQGWLTSAAGLWESLGLPSLVVFALFALKGAVMVFAGREAPDA